jgi:hypothetical protein
MHAIRYDLSQILMSELPHGFVSASHSILFESGDERCSVCAESLATSSDDDDDVISVRGRGLLVWTRGDERRYEEPALCPGCASAIGVTALQRWEIEEDEG